MVAWLVSTCVAAWLPIHMLWQKTPRPIMRTTIHTMMSHHIKWRDAFTMRYIRSSFWLGPERQQHGGRTQGSQGSSKQVKC